MPPPSFVLKAFARPLNAPWRAPCIETTNGWKAEPFTAFSMYREDSLTRQALFILLYKGGNWTSESLYHLLKGAQLPFGRAGIWIWVWFCLKHSSLEMLLPSLPWSFCWNVTLSENVLWRLQYGMAICSNPWRFSPPLAGFSAALTISRCVSVEPLYSSPKSLDGAPRDGIYFVHCCVPVTRTEPAPHWKPSKRVAESRKGRHKFEILCSKARSSNHLHEFSKKT